MNEEICQSAQSVLNGFHPERDPKKDGLALSNMGKWMSKSSLPIYGLSSPYLSNMGSPVHIHQHS